MIQLEKCSEYGNDGDLTGPDREHAETSMLALHLLQSALVHVFSGLDLHLLRQRFPPGRRGGEFAGL